MRHEDARAVERVEDQRLLTGTGNFVDDLVFDGMLHAAILRSAVAHGRLVRIDVTKARVLPGVHAVLTARDFGNDIPVIPLRLAPLPGVDGFLQCPIATDKVRYVGEPLAVVVAESRYVAEDALELIAVEIEPLPAVVDRFASQANDVLLFEQHGTNSATSYAVRKGDPDRAFATADYLRKETFRAHRHTASPLETRGMIAHWDTAREKLTVHGAAKVPHHNRRALAGMLGLPLSAVDLLEVDIGGGFGVRGEFHPEDYLIPFVARHLGRPVKWIEDRGEHFSATNHSREIDCELEIACMRDGAILGLRGRVWGDMGAYIRPNSGVVPAKAAQFLPGPYRIPNVAIEVVFAMTNKTPVGTYRGPGRFEANFFRERLVDIVAADLGIDPVEFRRRNLITSAELPYPIGPLVPYEKESNYDTGDYPLALEHVVSAFDYERLKEKQGRLINGRYHGIAVTSYVESSGAGPKENARMRLAASGRIEIYVGCSSLGQGLETIFAQIAGEVLGLPIEAFEVFHGSTTYVEEGFGTYHSRAVVMGGSAVYDAAQKFAAALCGFGGDMLGVPTSRTQWSQGCVTVGEGDASATLVEIAHEVARRGHAVEVQGTFENTKLTYTYGAHAAHVTVDPRTGDVKLLDYVALEDVGRAINPALVHGQAIGGLVQGLGGAFFDHLAYDAEGQLLTGSFADYLVPTATDFPNVRAITLELHRSPSNPLGAKGAGEGAIVMAAATMGCAIAAALRPLGVTINEMPFSPPRIWAAIERARTRL